MELLPAGTLHPTQRFHERGAAFSASLVMMGHLLEPRAGFPEQLGLAAGTVLVDGDFRAYRAALATSRFGVAIAASWAQATE